MHKQTNDQMLKKAIENALPEQEMFNEIEIKIGKYGNFIGCTNYCGGCKYKRKVSFYEPSLPKDERTESKRL